MRNKIALTISAAVLLAASSLYAQVYSPDISKVGQVDTTNLKTMVQDIYKQANAHTDREKAEAIWRFYLTDGRFVKPGVFYHIPGWAYEEPTGQVLDPIKLLNSYGFGLCYQDNPLLAATYEVGGMKARVWFLTGHTVAEVFYDGAYHMFDSDEMGYNPIGDGPLKKRDVASVYQLEHDAKIMTKNVTGPTTSNPKSVDNPWYPADVRAGDIPDLAQLYTTSSDNYLYAYNRDPHGFTMDFVLRPGERMIRYFRPASPDLFYLPYAYNGKDWNVLPDFATFKLKTSTGPRSEKDARIWATGKIEYRPADISNGISSPNGQDSTYTFSMPSPYVIIDADFVMRVSLPSAQDKLLAETSVDGGRTWTASGSQNGPFSGRWTAHAAQLPSSNGHRNAVSGTYKYLLRLSLHGASDQSPSIHRLLLTTLFQLNPRTLPALTPGENVFRYRAGTDVRTEQPVRTAHLDAYGYKVENASYVGQDGQGYVVNNNSNAGDVIFQVAAEHGNLSGFAAGGRFLDLRDGIAPNKFTAEIRKVTPWPANAKGPGAASISWSTSSSGPWKTLWTYNSKLTWLDGQTIPQVLRWPEVDRSVHNLPAGTSRVYVRYHFDGLAIDHFRLASIRPVDPSASQRLEITQIWKQGGVQHEFHKNIKHANQPQQYRVSVPERGTVENVALILECPPTALDRSDVAMK